MLNDFVPNSILIPKRAVRELQTMYQVYVLNENNTIENRILEVSNTVDQSFMVKSGLEVGDRIIVEGFEKVKPGTTIEPVPFKNELTNNK